MRFGGGQYKNGSIHPGAWARKCKGTAKHVTWFNPAQYAACNTRMCSALFSDADVRAMRPDQWTREAWVESESVKDEKKATRDSCRSYRTESNRIELIQPHMPRDAPGGHALRKVPPYPCAMPLLHRSFFRLQWAPRSATKAESRNGRRSQPPAVVMRPKHLPPRATQRSISRF